MGGGGKTEREKTVGENRTTVPAQLQVHRSRQLGPDKRRVNVTSTTSRPLSLLIMVAKDRRVMDRPGRAEGCF